jgi:hypothetical protein
MYLSADDARSDFFLAAALYVIGSTLLLLLVEALPAGMRGLLGPVFIEVVVPFLTTAAMPLFLMRYREESWAPLRTGGVTGLVAGIVAAGVLVAGALVAELVGGGQPAQVLTLPVIGYVGMVVRWGSLAVLAVFLVIRGEYAFRAISEPQADLVRKAGIGAVGTIGVATILMLLAGQPFASLLVAVALGGVFLVARGRFPQSGTGERWMVYAPAITLALGQVRIFSVLRGGPQFLVSAQRGAVLALFALIVVMGMHNRRGATVAFGLAAGFAVANLLVLGGGTRFPL